MTAPALGVAHRRALEISAALSLLMFVIEGGVGAWVGSAALLAAAVAFVRDAAVVALATAGSEWSRRERRFVSLAQGLAMAAVGVAATGEVIRRLILGGSPAPRALAVVGLLALVVNVYNAWRVGRFRMHDGAVGRLWRAACRDAGLDLLILIAAGLIQWTNSRWPDVVVGMIIAGVNLWSARVMLIGAWREVSRQS